MFLRLIWIKITAQTGMGQAPFLKKGTASQFSEDESSDNLIWIDLGQSPYRSDNSGQLNGRLGSPLPPSWFTGRNNHKQLSPKPASKISRSPIYDGREVNFGRNGDHILSFDAAVLSVTQELHHVKEVPEEELVETAPSSESNRKCANFGHDGEIQEEREISEESMLGRSSEMNGFNSQTFSQHASLSNCRTSGLCQDAKESAIRRETEGDFRLLGRREGNRFAGGRFFGVEENERDLSMGRKVSFSIDDRHKEPPGDTLESRDACSTILGVDESMSDGEDGDEQEGDRREPEVMCRHLDHVNMLGLNRTTLRLRYLINWLVTSLLQLRLPGSEGSAGTPLVQIYGPKIKFERGSAVAFNLRNSDGKLINPEIVQKLAEKNGISVGIGFLSHIRIVDSPKQHNEALDLDNASLCKPVANGRHDGKNALIRLEVVTASLGFLTNFEDVYRMWAFVAKFLNPAFVESEALSSVTDGLETENL